MALNTAIQVYRGLKANLPATTGKAGVIAWTTDSNELYVDSGTAFLPIASDIAVFTASSASAMTSLTAKVGDLCDRTDLHQVFILTAFPATVAGNWTAISPDASVTGIVGLSSGTTSKWVSYIDASGVQHLTQPSFTDISGQLSQTQLPTTIGAGTSLTNFDCGTF
jgi:hypothetical protein